MKAKFILRKTAGRIALLALGAALWLAAGRRASGGAPDDGAPSGAIAYFAGGTCPAGWTVAADLQGRLVVGVIDGTKAGVKVGTPLGDQEDRKHTHAWKGDVDLPDKSIAAADGSNNQGAAAGQVTVSGTTDEQTTGLPFVQVQPCVKQ